MPMLPNNLMTLLFHLYTSQELYQTSDIVHNQLTQLEELFPSSQWLKTQRALLFYHSKGISQTPSYVKIIKGFALRLLRL
jgi:anaphase-promoting complex subunit 8